MHLITNSLTNIIQAHGLIAVFFLMTAESALIPIPSEVTMPFAGFMAGLGLINFWTAVFVGALGNLLGSILSYWLGFKMGEEWIRGAINRWGKYLLINIDDFEKANHWLNKYGKAVTFTSRLLPIVRTFISLPAGISKMKFSYFVTLTLLGSLIWSAILAWFGLKFGQNWTVIEPYFRRFQALIIVLILIGVIVYIRRHIRKIRNGKTF